MKEKLDRKDPRFKRIQITVEAIMPTLVNEDGNKEALTTFRALVTDVIVDDNIIGSIGGGLGSVTLTHHNKDGEFEEWMIHHDDLWEAFQEAVENVE